ncbi:hypothetical protein ACNFJ7_05525 [Sphingomonas sp. HT-1]|uniref:hypothetical protein n=1 Tax=unclassified Sphingomonas TaxID=196159 RepID=UPI000315C4C3|nr:MULTISPECIES: hypothetical protein [unclassified Sphingomonas]KTF67514.1 hypothetical protein ATB93_17390 [Sphingomonas sp. WG]
MDRLDYVLWPAAAIVALALAGPAVGQGPQAQDGYADCAPRAGGIDAPRLRRAILAAARPRIGADTFFDDNVVVVAPARLGRGQPDVIAYVAGPRICGSGGCNAYVFEREGRAGYRPLGTIVPARLPIHVLETRHGGRQDLGVAVNGGGVRVGYVGALPFNGRRYAGNPTLSGVRHVARGSGTVLIGLPGQAEGQCRLR